MAHLVWLRNPVGSLLHLFHVDSLAPAKARRSVLDPVIDSGIGLKLAGKRRSDGRHCGPSGVEERSEYRPPFIEEMVMDLP